MLSDQKDRKVDWSQLTWEEAIVTVKTMVDRLGKRVDEGIIETVAVLNLLGFRTSQSCEGHLHRACPHPWVMIDADREHEIDQKWLAMHKLEEQARESRKIDDYDRYISSYIQYRLLAEQWRREDTVRPQLEALINDFYAHKDQEINPCRLVINQFLSGTCRIESGFKPCQRSPRIIAERNL